MDHAQDEDEQLGGEAEAPSRWEEAEEQVERELAQLPKVLGDPPQRLKLEVPDLLAERDDLVEAASDCDGRGQPYVRVCAAALLLCWRHAGRKQGAPRYKGDVMQFGGRAYEFLLGHGVTRTDILRTGGVALSLCIRAAVAQQQARESARGNSRGLDERPSSSSSTSSVTTVSSSPVASLALSRKEQDS